MLAPQRLFQRPILLTGHTAAVYALAPWQGGVLSGGGDGQLVYWPVDGTTDGRLVAQLDDRIVAILPLGDGEADAIVLGTLSGDLYWLDLSRPQQPRRWALHRDGVFALVRQGNFVLAAGGDGRLSRWRATAGTLVDLRSVDTVRLRSLAVVGAEAAWGLPERLLVGTAAGDVCVLDAAELATLPLIERAHTATVFSLVVAGGRVYSAGRDGAIRVWETSPPYRQIAFVAAHGATVNQLALDPSGSWLASAGRDRELRVWHLGEDGLPVLAKALTALRDGGHTHSVNACCWVGDALVSGGDDRGVRVWVRSVTHTTSTS